MMNDVMRWNPFDELRRFADEFDRRISSWSPRASGFFSPIQVSSTDEGRRIRVALPGIAPENVEVSVAGQTVHVRAVEKNADDVVTRYEELIALPESIDSDRVTASLRHGMLDLTLPYREDIKPRRIEVVTNERKQLSSAA